MTETQLVTLRVLARYGIMPRPAELAEMQAMARAGERARGGIGAGAQAEVEVEVEEGRPKFALPPWGVLLILLALAVVAWGVILAPWWWARVWGML